MAIYIRNVYYLASMIGRMSVSRWVINITSDKSYVQTYLYSAVSVHGAMHVGSTLSGAPYFSMAADHVLSDIVYICTDNSEMEASVCENVD